MERIENINCQLTSAGNTKTFNGRILSPPDAIFGIVANFKKDEDKRKVDVSVGAYRDDNGNPVILEAVKKAEELILANKTLNKIYLLIAGHGPFIETAQKLIFGDKNLLLKTGQIGSL